MWGERRDISRARAAGAFLVIILLVFLGGLTSVNAADPSCDLAPGWQVGDPWGPGEAQQCPPESVIGTDPFSPPPPVSEPMRAPAVQAVGLPAPSHQQRTLPPTDTAP